MCAIVDVFIDMMLCTSITKWHHVAMWLVTNTWYKNNMCPVLLARPSHFWVCENRTKKKRAHFFWLCKKRWQKTKNTPFIAPFIPAHPERCIFFFFMDTILESWNYMLQNFGWAVRQFERQHYILRCFYVVGVALPLDFWFPRCSHVNIYLSICLFIYLFMVRWTAFLFQTYLSTKKNNTKKSNKIDKVVWKKKHNTKKRTNTQYFLFKNVQIDRWIDG